MTRRRQFHVQRLHTFDARIDAAERALAAELIRARRLLLVVELVLAAYLIDEAAT